MVLTLVPSALPDEVNTRRPENERARKIYGEPRITQAEQTLAELLDGWSSEQRDTFIANDLANMGAWEREMYFIRALIAAAPQSTTLMGLRDDKTASLPMTAIYCIRQAKTIPPQDIMRMPPEVSDLVQPLIGQLQRMHNLLINKEGAWFVRKEKTAAIPQPGISKAKMEVMKTTRAVESFVTALDDANIPLSDHMLDLQNYLLILNVDLATRVMASEEYWWRIETTQRPILPRKSSIMSIPAGRKPNLTLVR